MSPDSIVSFVSVSLGHSVMACRRLELLLSLFLPFVACSLSVNLNLTPQQLLLLLKHK